MHTLSSTARTTTKKRVGRGGKRGKTSGRGMKGQNARAGATPRPEMRDIIKKIPKLRGHGKNRGQTHVYRPGILVINCSDLEVLFAAGETVSPATLSGKKIWSAQSMKRRGVKILGNGNIAKALTIEGCNVSQSAKEKIEKAGGTIIEKKEEKKEEKKKS